MIIQHVVSSFLFLLGSRPIDVHLSRVVDRPACSLERRRSSRSRLCSDATDDNNDVNTSAPDSNGGDSDSSVPTPSLNVNDNEETYFNISPKRRVTIKEWEGNVLLDIREYYTKSEKELPGKKGISLTIQQYKLMRDLIIDGTVDDMIRDLGGDI
eukprot:763324_1